MSDAPFIMALDIATTTGWATSYAGRSGVCELQPAKARAAKPGRPAKVSKRDGRILRPAVEAIPAVDAEPEHSRCGKLAALLSDLWNNDDETGFSPGPQRTFVVVEAAVQHHVSVNSARIAHELHGVVKAWCWTRRLTYVEVTPQDLKRFACGRCNVEKPEMLAAALRMTGYTGADDNEGEARLLLEWARRHLVEVAARKESA